MESEPILGSGKCFERRKKEEEEEVEGSLRWRELRNRLVEKEVKEVMGVGMASDIPPLPEAVGIRCRLPSRSRRGPSR